MPQKSTSKASHWHKNNEPAQFIVRQILSGKISIKEPDFAKFVRDNPSFGKANDKNLRRNFKNTVDRWRNFSESGQGKQFKVILIIII